MIERRYRLLRLDHGDYLLPSNDGQIAWRISSYVEDGSLVAYEPGDRRYEHGRTIRGTFWQTARFRGSLQELQALAERDPEGFLDWDRWETWSAPHATRAEAIEAALSAPGR